MTNTFTLTDNGTITHDEYSDIKDQMTLVEAPAYLYFLATESVQTIEDNSNLWEAGDIESLFADFIDSEFASEKSDAEIFALMFSGKYDVQNLASILLWNEDHQFAAALVASMNSDVDSAILFNKIGIENSPLADALIASRDFSMGRRVASAFVFEVLSGKNVVEALEAARKA